MTFNSYQQPKVEIGKLYFEFLSKENWYKCSGHSDFKFAAIERAQNTCRQILSTIQSNFSEVFPNSNGIIQKKFLQSDLERLASDPKITKNETMDKIFKYNFNSTNPYLTIKVWTGTRTSDYFQLTDEYGVSCTFKEFLKKTGTQRFITGDQSSSDAVAVSQFLLTQELGLRSSIEPWLRQFSNKC